MGETRSQYKAVCRAAYPVADKLALPDLDGVVDHRYQHYQDDGRYEREDNDFLKHVVAVLIYFRRREFCIRHVVCRIFPELGQLAILKYSVISENNYLRIVIVSINVIGAHKALRIIVLEHLNLIGTVAAADKGVARIKIHLTRH